MTSLTLGSVAVRGKEHVETEMNGQVLMMSLDQGKYFALDNTGRRIWELLAEPTPLDRIVTILTEEYDVDAERCSEEVLAFAERLLKNGLIVATDP